MTSGKRSKSAKSAARSNESRDEADARLIDDVESRVRTACDMLGIPSGPSRIVVACSGGSDSAAALFAVRSARPTAQLIACYVDHDVRPRANITKDKRGHPAPSSRAFVLPVRWMKAVHPKRAFARGAIGRSPSSLGRNALPS